MIFVGQQLYDYYCDSNIIKKSLIINNCIPSSYKMRTNVPRAEICCEIGRLFMEKREYVTAAYWYQQALLAPRKKKNGGFYIADSHDFIPAIQMCVCLDKAGRHREAFEFHKKARVLKPLHQAVIGNEKYFWDVWGME